MVFKIWHDTERDNNVFVHTWEFTCNKTELEFIPVSILPHAEGPRSDLKCRDFILELIFYNTYALICRTDRRQSFLTCEPMTWIFWYRFEKYQSIGGMKLQQECINLMRTLNFQSKWNRFQLKPWKTWGSIEFTAVVSIAEMNNTLTHLFFPFCYEFFLEH